jgi:hypothetical protein
MRSKKNQPVQTFPSWTGRDRRRAQIRSPGCAKRVWAESRLYREDVETLLGEWLAVAGCVVRDEELAMLLSKARGEFARLATTSEADEAPQCPAHDLVQCLYWDVQRLESNGVASQPSNGLTAPQGQ